MMNTIPLNSSLRDADKNKRKKSRHFGEIFCWLIILLWGLQAVCRGLLCLLQSLR